MAKFFSGMLTTGAALLISLAGCGAGTLVAPNGPNFSGQRTQAIGPDRLRSLVYVSDQLEKAVVAFPASERANNPPPVKTFNFGVITEGVWVDRNGILYAALSGKLPSQAGEVEEFKPGASSPFLTITNGIGVPQFLVVDGKGTLYVDQVSGVSVQILEYPAGKTSPATMLSLSDKGEPSAGGLTLDSSGNIYVHAFFLDDPPSRVYRFAAGQTNAQDLKLSGLGDTTGLSSDGQGNLYVSDSAGGISVYPAGKTAPSRKISPARSQYFDDFVATRSGKLYVAQGEGGSAQASLLEYAAGASQPANVLSGYLQGPLIPALRGAAF